MAIPGYDEWKLATPPEYEAGERPCTECSQRGEEGESDHERCVDCDCRYVDRHCTACDRFLPLCSGCQGERLDAERRRKAIRGLVRVEPGEVPTIVIGGKRFVLEPAAVFAGTEAAEWFARQLAAEIEKECA